MQATTPLTQFYLCRHGQSLANASNVLQGQSESPLTLNGKEQALALASKARHWHIHHVVSSHLGRAMQTGEICARQLAVEHTVANDFAERHLGLWQAQPLENVPEFKTYQQFCYQRTDIAAGSHGETTRTVQKRMLHGLMQLAQQFTALNILVISHGDALACLMSTFQAPLVLNNTQGIQLSYQPDNQQLQWAGLLD
jgi:broad specificity phosphatase PhoE